MAEITLDREAYESLKSGNASFVAGDDKLASFLVNQFDEDEAAAKAAADEPTWIYNIWTYTF